MSHPHNYDYVVIGGGTAGLVVAARLAEDPNVSICVIEAGQDQSNNPDVAVPGFAIKNMGNPAFDWSFMSTPQVGANNRSIFLPRGKGLGGSSILNIMTMERGHALEYNAFETLGSAGWNWESLLTYFKKSETLTITPNAASDFGVKFNPHLHGNSGPLQRTFPRWTTDADKPFFKAMEAIGIPSNPDSYGGDNIGLWTSACSIDPVKVTRSSSSSAYYEPNKLKPNLQVIIGAEASRILFKKSESTGKLVAQGVEYSKDGKLSTISAKKEVLLCTGSYQTPKLLELSGIGDKKILESHGIPVLFELPGVGINLLTSEMDSKYDSFEVLANPERAAKEWKLYEESKTGMLTSPAASTHMFLPQSFIADTPAIASAVKEIKALGIGQSSILEIQKDWFTGSKVPIVEFAPFPGFLPAPGKTAEPGKSYFSFFIALLHPFSKGSVHISSSDPFAPPIINKNVFDNEADLEVMVQAVKFARKAVQTEDMRSVVGKEIIPGPERESDASIKEWIKDTVQTVYHPIGTASMRPLEDGGVVDANLKVYGTENLRVIDASIIPIQVSAKTQATVYAIAERAADIIKSA